MSGLQPHAAQDFAHTLLTLRRRRAYGHQRLGNGRTDPQPGIQRRKRILKDHLQPAGIPCVIAARHAGQYGFTVEKDFPAVGGRSRTAMRASVDLPHPDSPTRPSVSPRRTESDTPSTARTSPRTLPSTPCRTVNERLTSRKSRSGEEAEDMHTPRLKRKPKNVKPENRLAF